MGNWLGRASTLFQPPTPPDEPFIVECDCGGHVTGIRTGNYQKPKCPNCACAVFVLPLNVYPGSKPVPRKVTTIEASSTKEAAARPKTVIREASEPIAPPKKPLPGNVANPASVRGDAIAAVQVQPVAHQLTPIRLVAAAIVLLSALAVGGLWHRNRIERAKGIVNQSAEAGFAAIQERDFEKASHELLRARRAVDLIGRNDQAAQKIRRFSRESIAMAKLASGTLTEIIEESLSTHKAGKPGAIALSSAYQGAWLLLDCQIVQTDQKGIYRVETPIEMDDWTVRVEMKSPLFQRLNLTDESGEPARVVFAAQIEGMSEQVSDSPHATLTLSESSVFLWTDYDNYVAVGYEPFDAESESSTRQLMERQLAIQSP